MKPERFFVSGESNIGERDFYENYVFEIQSKIDDCDNHDIIPEFLVSIDSDFGKMTVDYLVKQIKERVELFSDGQCYLELRIYHLFDEPAYRVGELCPDGTYRININSKHISKDDEFYIDYDEWPIIHYHGDFDSFEDMDIEMTENSDIDIAFIKEETRTNCRTIKNIIRRHLIK